MSKNNNYLLKAACWSVVAALLLALTVGGAPEPAPTTTSGVKQVPPGQENSGFLSDYSKLQPDPDVEGEMLTYVNPDELKDLHRYVVIMVDPVQVYLVTGVDPSELPDRGRTAVVEYFQYSIKSAVADAFPIVTEPGPLVLRLRTALVGVDVGGEVETGGMPDETEALERTINIAEVMAEFELVDSVSGDVIAAAIDKAKLGAGAEIGATHFQRMERFDAARAAFDTWAEGLREFLDVKHELTGEDAERADQSYVPYGQ